MGEAHSYTTRIDLPADARVKLVDLLNERLADCTDLWSQCKQAHWNVKGSDFFQLHELFDALATNLLAHTDLIAERATTLGGEALGTVRMAAVSSGVAEFPREAYEGLDALDALADRFATLAARVRSAADQATAFGDADTNDLLVEVSRAVDKDLWFLEAHLQKAR